MIKNKNKNKIIYLKNYLFKKEYNIFSIFQNNEINWMKKKEYNIYKKNKKNKKKSCIFGLSNKYINKKFKLSRFGLKYLINNNLNQNFKKND